MSAIVQLLARKGGNPGLVCAATRPQFGDDDQVLGIGMKGLFYDLVGHMRAVIVAGVDVIYARSDRLSQYDDRRVNVPWRPVNFGAGKLHRPIAHAVEAGRGAGECEGSAKLCLSCHVFFLLTLCLKTTLQPSLRSSSRGLPRFSDPARRRARPR